MSIEEAKEQGFTHHAELYGVPIFYKDCESSDIEAKNKWLGYWLDFLIWIECHVGVNEYGFPIKIKEPL